MGAVTKSNRLCPQTLYFFTAYTLYALWGLLGAGGIIVGCFTALAGAGQIQELVDEDEPVGSA